MIDKTNTVRSRSLCIKRIILEVMQLRPIVLQWVSVPPSQGAQVVYKEWKHLSTRTLHGFVSVEKEYAYCIVLGGLCGKSVACSAGLKWLCADRLLNGVLSSNEKVWLLHLKENKTTLFSGLYLSWLEYPAHNGTVAGSSPARPIEGRC